jgi:hypothetical protein
MNNPALLTTQKLKNSAKRLKKDLNNKGLSINYNETLQMQTQSLFCKPYEEVKETILKEKKEKLSIPVYCLHYCSEIIVICNDHFITQLNLGTQSEISIDSLLSIAQNTASMNNSIVTNVHLPEILNEDWENEDVLLLAKKLGYTSDEQNIFIDLENHNKIFINNIHCPYGLNGEWESELNGNEDGEDMCVWYPEMQEGFDLYEFYFSFKDLCNAKYKDGKWIIEQNNQFIIIEII